MQSPPESFPMTEDSPKPPLMMSLTINSNKKLQPDFNCDPFYNSFRHNRLPRPIQEALYIFTLSNGTFEPDEKVVRYSQENGINAFNLALPTQNSLSAILIFLLGRLHHSGWSLMTMANISGRESVDTPLASPTEVISSFSMFMSRQRAKSALCPHTLILIYKGRRRQLDRQLSMIERFDTLPTYEEALLCSRVE